MELISTFAFLITLNDIGEVLKLREKGSVGHFPRDRGTGFSINENEMIISCLYTNFIIKLTSYEQR